VRFGVSVPLTARHGADISRRTADVDGRRRIRSIVSDTLVVAPTNRSTLGDRAFPSRAWNDLFTDLCCVLIVESLNGDQLYLDHYYWIIISRLHIT